MYLEITHRLTKHISDFYYGCLDKNLDRKGYFKWHANLNLYIEVLSWDKLLKDADMRNKVFFHQLGIN